jgi:hypothetical protein
MSEPSQQPKPEEQTTILHLSEFASAGPGEAPPGGGGEESPTMIIRKAAEKTAAESLQAVVTSKTSALAPKAMLGAVAYCYAKGVYRSEDIERKMMKDPAFRAAVGDEVPNARAIRLFRRHNRDAILMTLGKFFRWWRARPVVAPGAEAAPASQPASENTQFFVKTEASDTLNKAAWVDNMAKDE